MSPLVRQSGWCVLLGLAWLAVPAQADIYQYRDAYGHITLTDKPMKGRQTLVKVYRQPSRPSQPDQRALAERRRTYEPMITRVAREQQLHPALLHAVVQAESAYNPKAVSAKGAMGLMQLMPATADRYGVHDRADPYQNLLGGARYLKDLLALFGNNLSLALAAYNAGENAVIRHGNRVPPYPETQDYVRKVREFYAALGGGEQGSATAGRSLAVR